LYVKLIFTTVPISVFADTLRIFATPYVG